MTCIRVPHFNLFPTTLAASEGSKGSKYNKNQWFVNNLKIAARPSAATRGPQRPPPGPHIFLMRSEGSASGAPEVFEHAPWGPLGAPGTDPHPTLGADPICSGQNSETRILLHVAAADTFCSEMSLLLRTCDKKGSLQRPSPGQHRPRAPLDYKTYPPKAPLRHKLYRILCFKLVHPPDAHSTSHEKPSSARWNARND